MTSRGNTTCLLKCPLMFQVQNAKTMTTVSCVCHECYVSVQWSSYLYTMSGSGHNHSAKFSDYTPLRFFLLPTLLARGRRRLHTSLRRGTTTRRRWSCMIVDDRVETLICTRKTGRATRHASSRPVVRPGSMCSHDCCATSPATLLLPKTGRCGYNRWVDSEVIFYSEISV